MLWPACQTAQVLYSTTLRQFKLTFLFTPFSIARICVLYFHTVQLNQWWWIMFQERKLQLWLNALHQYSSLGAGGTLQCWQIHWQCQPSFANLTVLTSSLEKIIKNISMQSEWIRRCGPIQVHVAKMEILSCVSSAPIGLLKLFQRI